MPFIPVGKRCSLLQQVSMKPKCDYIRQCRGEFTWRGGGGAEGCPSPPNLDKGGGGECQSAEMDLLGAEEGCPPPPNLGKGGAREVPNKLGCLFIYCSLHTYIHYSAHFHWAFSVADYIGY